MIARHCLTAPLAAFSLLLTTPAFCADRIADNIVYIVRPGDTLIGIGQRLLNQPGRWKQVQKANRIADPFHILPGTRLLIPAPWMRLVAVTAKVTAVSGEVSGPDAPLRVGDPLKATDQITTGTQGFVTLELIDGSRLTLQPESRLRIDDLHRYIETEQYESTLKLEAGRVESSVTKTDAPRPKFIINTPAAAIGVRGTQFRVASDSASGHSRAEVTDGTVAVGGTQGAAIPIKAGQGVIASSDGAVGQPVPLLAAPDLSGVPLLHERSTLLFRVPPVPEALAYRFQIAADKELRTLLAEQQATAPEAKFADLPDGEYTLRIRAIDGNGLEGRDADLRFRLKARPEPPFATAPVANSKLRAETVTLSWSRNPEASRYRVQLSLDPSFATLIAEADVGDETSFVPDGKLPPGDYLWRVRSQRESNDLGPWGDPQKFQLRGLPAEPQPPQMDAETLSIAWSGEPGQVFLFQLARDREFTDIVAELHLDKPSVQLPRPEPDLYYVRIRATDADGYVGPFTTPQSVKVPFLPPPWWSPAFLLPILLI